MLFWKRFRWSVAFLLCSFFRATAQHFVADPVMEGSSISYWVDSTQHPGSTYVWAINDSVTQCSTLCLFTHRWIQAGQYNLTVRQITAPGCSGADQTIRVLVVEAEPTISIYPNPAYGPDLFFKVLLPYPADVTIDIFSPFGQLVDRIAAGPLPGAVIQTIPYHHLLPQGIYPYQIYAGKAKAGGKMVVLRTYCP